MTKKPTYEELEQRIEELDQRESERKQAEEALRENEEKYRIVVENSSDAIRVFNETGHLYANRACLELLGYKWEELRAMDGWAVVAPECREWTRERGLKRLKGENISGRIEIPMLCKDGKKLTVEVMVNSIRINGQPAIISCMRDITERVRAEEERERLISDLQNALAEVKTLSGLLPICSHCKNVRDDKGYWSKIEAYIHKHSGTEFSHGICPECAKKYFPDMDIYDDNGEVTEG